jgi:NAD(P)-dependent dehydrogenase (short-subunit alcohol dehydrogenase family)
VSGAEERWALILGASVGTGAAIAEVIAEDPSFKVIGFHRGNHKEDAQTLVENIADRGGHMIMCESNAGDPEHIPNCIEAVQAHLPRQSIKLFVHSLSGASLGHFLHHDNMPESDQLQTWQFEKTFNYIAHSFPYWSRALHEADLLAPQARLVGLTNALENQMLHNCGLIAASKAALEQYIRYLSAELGKYDHRVNLVRFGSVITPALERMLGPEASEEFEQAHLNLLAAGRTCKAEEVARFIALLTRQDTHWFNGATIDFTGGLTQRLLDVVYNPDWLI